MFDDLPEAAITMGTKYSDKVSSKVRGYILDQYHFGEGVTPNYFDFVQSPNNSHQTTRTMLLYDL